jgi:hypothetical protein
MLLAHVSAAAAQRRVPGVEGTTDLGDPTGLVIGVSGSIVFVSREVFLALDPGYGLQFFLGSEFSPIDELRAGVAISSHSDFLAQDKAKLLSIYLEAYFKRDISAAVALRIAPRIAWMQVTRSNLRLAADGQPIFGGNPKLRGVGVGGFAGAQLALGSHGSIETGVVLTLHTIFGDANKYGTVLELRLGGRLRL